MVAYGAISRAALAETNAQFIRVFAGKAQAGDVAALAHDYNCRIAVVARSDGAWLADPFSSSTEYTLLEANPNWRIYGQQGPGALHLEPAQHTSAQPVR